MVWPPRPSGTSRNSLSPGGVRRVTRELRVARFLKGGSLARERREGKKFLFGIPQTVHKLFGVLAGFVGMTLGGCSRMVTGKFCLGKLAVEKILFVFGDLMEVNHGIENLRGAWCLDVLELDANTFRVSPR